MLSRKSRWGSASHTQPDAGWAAPTEPEAWQAVQVISSETGRTMEVVATTALEASRATIFIIG